MIHRYPRNFQAHLVRDISSMTTRLFVRADLDGGKHLALGFSQEEFDRGQMSPSLELQDDLMKELVQAIVDEAYRNGIKPREMDKHLRESEHMKAHLSDMRAIAFKRLGMEGR